VGLENLFCWVPWLIKWLVGWVPHFGRLHSFEMGVKASGRRYKVLHPGFYVWIPHFSNIYSDNVVRKVVELPEQLLTTADGVRVRVGGLLVYTIEKIEVWILDNDDPDHGLFNEAARVLRNWVRSRSFDEIQEIDNADHDDLTMEATNAMELDFGIDVRSLALTSFARTDSIDLHHSGTVKTNKSDGQPLMIAVGE
jgi:SPFH domain/Band 7 family protein